MHSAFEHQHFPGFLPTDHHLRLIDRLNKTLSNRNDSLLQIVRKDGAFRLRATQFVGVLRLGNTTLQILPKMYALDSPEKDHASQATRNLLVLLSYALDLPLLEHHAATLQHQSHNWLELLTRLFATNLRQQFHAAPHRAYQSFDDDLPLLRGKLRIADQLRRPDRQHLFACTYDEFSIDNALNRVFRFVVERLFFLTRSHENRATLAELRDTLDPVTLVTRFTPADADPTRLLTRLNRRYLPLLQLARLFLSDHTPQLSPGTLDTFNFLFDMNALFESFVAGFLKRHRPEILPDSLQSATLSSQRPRKYLLREPAADRGHFLLHPDLTFHHGNNFALILDTKYKRLDPSHPRYKIAPADIYQMLAYAYRYHCPQILLLYPQTAELQEPLHKTFVLDSSTDNITFTAATLNLTQDLTTHQGRADLITEFRNLFDSLAPAPPAPTLPPTAAALPQS